MIYRGVTTQCRTLQILIFSNRIKREERTCKSETTLAMFASHEIMKLSVR